MQLSGELAKVSFANLLQLVRSGGLAGKLTLSQGALLGAILIEKGLPVHAEIEGLSGKEALFEFFLWLSGTFAFSEGAFEGLNKTLPRTIKFNNSDDTFERLLKDGIAYLEAKQYLDSLGVGPESVLKAADQKGDYARTLMQNPGLERIDGVRTLADALSALNLTGREFTLVVADWFYGGLVQIAKPDYGLGDNQVELPDWVVARLKQDNQDLTKAIVDMVIWVDRVKCWMYQTDADFERILAGRDLGNIAGAASIVARSSGNTGAAGGAQSDVTAPAKPPAGSF